MTGLALRAGPGASGQPAAIGLPEPARGQFDADADDTWAVTDGAQGLGRKDGDARDTENLDGGRSGGRGDGRSGLGASRDREAAMDTTITVTTPRRAGARLWGPARIASWLSGRLQAAHLRRLGWLMWTWSGWPCRLLLVRRQYPGGGFGNRPCGVGRPGPRSGMSC